MSIINSIVKTKNQRAIKKLKPIVDQINSLSDKYKSMSDIELREASEAIRTKVRSAKNINNTDISESFALIRETSARVLGMPHYDVQIIGGLVLNQGKIAEMRTGEGKTLVSTLSSYINSILGQVHIVTVNDYLAKRDCEIVKPIFDFLNVSINYLQDNFDNNQRKDVYEADVVYGTSSQFGFDYLKDNMIINPEDRLQKCHHYAIIDEADSVLIDEARTPLIISGNGDEDVTRYTRIFNMTEQFDVQIKSKEDSEQDDTSNNADVILIEKTKSSRFTESGYAKLEKLMINMGVIKTNSDLYSQQFLSIVTDFQTAFKAKHLYEKDVHYIVREEKVEIIDENTGRIAEGRRWSDGLHQFIEAKESVNVNPETVSLGSITLQNFFRLYEKVSGMTGTADTDASEFHTVYNLDVVVIPTNKPILRVDGGDSLYMTHKGKIKAIVEDIKTRHENGQPILVGTSSVEKSEEISNELNKLNISHNILNAKNHAQEAMIIAQAGRSKAVTIATNMAGRGTDIILGGNWKLMVDNLIGEPDEATINAIKESCEKDYLKVISSGGLHVIGTERHDSRRIDNQLRGRSGRQGDVGSSTFYVSLEDRIMRIYGTGKLYSYCKALGLSDEDCIPGKMIKSAIEKSQMKIENHNFEQRKDLIKFDEIVSRQRNEIYKFRNSVVDAGHEELINHLTTISRGALGKSVKRFLPDNTYIEQWDLHGLNRFVRDTLRIGLDIPIDPKKIEVADNNKFSKEISDAYFNIFEACSEFISQHGHNVDEMIKAILLQSIDKSWRENIHDMERLQDGIHLRGYIQKDPKVEFARESIIRFSDMIEDISENFMVSVFRTATEYAKVIQEQTKNSEAA